jgi:hypothetical protein
MMKKIKKVDKEKQTTATQIPTAATTTTMEEDKKQTTPKILMK